MSAYDQLRTTWWSVTAALNNWLLPHAAYSASKAYQICSLQADFPLTDRVKFHPSWSSNNISKASKISHF